MITNKVNVILQMRMGGWGLCCLRYEIDFFFDGLHAAFLVCRGDRLVIVLSTELELNMTLGLRPSH